MTNNVRSLSCLLAFATLFPISSPAQSGWYHLSSPGDLSTIFFIDSVNGWVGGNGGIYRTTDGGLSWVSQVLPVVTGISKLYFRTSSVGFATGSGGTILKTTNSGTTWNQKQSGTHRGLSSIYFLNSQLGWACGVDTVTLTTDQGETWSTRSVPAIAHWDISFRNSQEGWVVGLYGSCFKSTDGGNIWSSASPPIAGRSLFGVCFPTASRGVVVGGEQIALSTNAGSSWISVYNSGGQQLNSVSFADSLTGWVVGSYKIVKTTNGGATWFEQSWPTPQRYLTAAHCSDNQHAWAIGDQTLLRTTNGGGVTSVHSSNELIPNSTILYQNYPNPFNPTTVIGYKLPTSGFVSLRVFDIGGREVQTLVDKYQNSGDYSVLFTGTSLASGVYCYCLQVNSFSLTKNLVLLK